MNDKQLVLDEVQKMPETSTVEEIAEHLAIVAALNRAKAASKEGRVVSHEEVKQRVASWISK
jgi:predicted transcriptional regulator